jgi:TolB protein
MIQHTLTADPTPRATLRAKIRWAFSIAAAAVALATLNARSQTPPAQQPPTPPPQQPTEIATVIRSEGGAAARLAVPDFIALSPDAETAAIARTIGRVLFDDIAFEKEFALIPRDTYATIPAATSFTDVPFGPWRELGADGLIVGTVQKASNGIVVQVRLFKVTTGLSAFGKEYTGSAANPRVYAHSISDDIHLQQRALRGVAMTRLAFSSDRDGERIGGTIEQRAVKEIYYSDYDGENQKRLTINRSLNIMPAWSPDANSLAYISFRGGHGGNILIANIRGARQGTQDDLTGGKGENWLPAFSPDGTRVAFSSTRDGNPEIYVANGDGSNVRRLTNHPGIDTSPTWSPSGTQIAFVSDRTGSPQLWIIGVDGLDSRKLPISESYADRPTWSPAPYNEIAFAARAGPGFDIKVFDVTNNTVHALTFGEGSSESPSWAPNGRHLAFSSNRSGKYQIFTVGRDGKDVRQITRTGDNRQPDWSKK